MRWSYLWLTIAACYHPDPSPGAPCGLNGECPSSLVCSGGRCVVPGASQDGPVADSNPPDTVSDIGCADGTREGFTDRTTFPRIAGCAATWSGPANLRAMPTGEPCGDALGTCNVPADACAPGWSICGRSGDPSTISSQATAEQCTSAGGTTTGAFAAALGHCSAFPCVYDTPYACIASGSCSEPVCCGVDCSVMNGCQAGVYPDPATHVAGDLTNGCAALLPSSASGVLCCRD